MILASALRTAPYVDAFRTVMYDTVICVAVGPRASMYGAVKPIHAAYNNAFSSHARKHTYLLKAGNRALESVGFMMQRAPRRPLPTGHHSNDLVPLPAGTIPDDDDALLRNVARPPPPDMPGNYCRRLC